MSGNFFGGTFFSGGFFGANDDAAIKTGTGGIDPPKRRTIYKPTGLINRPKTPVDVRVEETRQIHAEVTQKLKSEFTEPDALDPALEFQPIERMSQAEIDNEIGMLLRVTLLEKMHLKKIHDTEEEELMMMLMMIARL